MYSHSHSSPPSPSKPSLPIGLAGRISPLHTGIYGLHGSGANLAAFGSPTSSGGSRGKSSGQGPAPMGSASSSRHGSRTVSPLNLPMENVQSISAAYSLNHGYLESGILSSISNLNVSPSRSPYQSPTHRSRMASASSIGGIRGSLPRERSAERSESDFDHSTASLDRRGFYHMPRESSRERRCHISRERSIDREYPHMGARSLEREHGIYYRVGRSRSTEHDSSTNHMQSTPPHLGVAKSQEFLHHARDSIMLDLQAQISELSKDCAMLQHELDLTKDKLNSSMNSIKTFWSPELKKERALRKEEYAKSVHLNEQCKTQTIELQRNVKKCQDLESRIRKGNSGHVTDVYSISSTQDGIYNSLSPKEMDTLKRDKEKQAKEVRILRKTVDEMELRIETQKQTLMARDESIKKLLEMLQSKGLSTSQLEEDRREKEKLQTEVIEKDRAKCHAEMRIEEKEKQLDLLREELTNLTEQFQDAQVQLRQFPANSASMQAIMDSKDSRIAALEKELRVVEDELLQSREESILAEKDRKPIALSREGSLTRSSEKSLKAEVESLQIHLVEKDKELCGYKLTAETSEKQHQEYQHHIILLKEQISTKEKHSAMVQAEILDFENRLKEKDAAVDQKSRQVTVAQMDRRRIEGELAELKDHLDIKDRKVNVLQRKIENLEGLVGEKEDQLAQLQIRISSISIDQTSTDSALSSLEESISEKERQIERLKEQREKSDRENQDEYEEVAKQNQELKFRLEALQSELMDKQSEMCGIRDEASDLRSEKLLLESRGKELEIELGQCQQEVEQLLLRAQQLESALELEKQQKDIVLSDEMEQKIFDLSHQVEVYKGEKMKAQAELDRLLEILKETENEKHQKDTSLRELQELVKEYKNKCGTLKRSQQTEKKKSAQLLEEARKREDEMADDSTQMKTEMSQREERIEELEEALRESVQITAEREMVVADQHERIEQSDKQLGELSDMVEKLNASLDEKDKHIEEIQKTSNDAERKLRKLQAERRRQMEEVYEMKQEALQAAICEKDANIALLELTSTKQQRNIDDMAKLNIEKERLHQQLKEITHARMKLLNSEEHIPKKKSLAKSMKASTPEQVLKALRKMEHSKKRLTTLIDQVVATCLDINPQLLDSLPRLQLNMNSIPFDELRKLSKVQLLFELHQAEKACTDLQDYLQILLQRLRTACPEKLEAFFVILEPSDPESCASSTHEST